MKKERLPSWLRIRLPEAAESGLIERLTYEKGLATVCREARCPNQGDCAHDGTATFLILGSRCTRNCRFCAVLPGEPEPVMSEEPDLVAQSIATLGLRHAVITSVTRDDLVDGGASQFARTILAIRRTAPGTTVEVLIPDFQGCDKALREVVDAGPDVLNHNLETVPRLYPVLRIGASYARSLDLLRRVLDLSETIITKSGIMVGAGESFHETTQVIKDLAGVGCVVLTIGQYLRPTRLHHPVDRFVPPAEFEDLRAIALDMGIKKVMAGPLVRSSYRAAELLQELRTPA